MITIIAAMTKDRVIGKQNDLPWNIPEDMENFKRLTAGKTVVMGRRTYESIPTKYRPLPNRHNVIISSSMSPEVGIDVCRTIQEGLEKAKEYGKEICIVGGATIYKQFLPFTDTMHLSFIKQEYEGDTFFPEFNESEWDIEQRKDYQQFELVTYRRKQ